MIVQLNRFVDEPKQCGNGHPKYDMNKYNDTKMIRTLAYQMHWFRRFYFIVGDGDYHIGKYSAVQ